MTDEDPLVIVQLMRHEGVRLRAYTDTKGKVTIGIGRNLTDCGITRDEALGLCRADLVEVYRDLRSFPWWEALDPVRQRAMVDMRFNLGPTRFRSFRRMLAAIHDGNFASAARQMLASQWHLDVGTRAERLADMIDTGRPLDPL